MQELVLRVAVLVFVMDGSDLLTSLLWDHPVGVAVWLGLWALTMTTIITIISIALFYGGREATD